MLYGDALRQGTSLVAVSCLLCLGGAAFGGEEVRDEQAQPKKFGLAAVFTALGTIGEVVGGVFELIEAFNPDPAMEQLNVKLDAMDQKLDNLQVKLDQVGQEVQALSVAFKIGNDKVISQIVNVAMDNYVNTINAYSGDLQDKVKYYNQLPKAQKDKAFQDGSFVNAIKATCPLANMQRAKANAQNLTAYLVGKSSYTGALDAYTDTLINRITVVQSGETWPDETLERAYALLSDYYTQNIMVAFKAVAYVQAHYYANNNRAEFLIFYDRFQRESLAPAATKFLDCANRLVTAQANLRSVNDTGYLSLFRELKRNDQTVYSQEIVDKLCRAADLLAAETAYLKIKGVSTIHDDAGNTKQVEGLVNRKKLGLFARVFGEPSRLPSSATYAYDNSSTSTPLPSPAGYSNLVPAAKHADWQWQHVQDNCRWWKKTPFLCAALYHLMAEDMSNGAWSVAFNLSLPSGSGVINKTENSGGRISLVAYDLETGEPATDATPEANKVMLQYHYLHYPERGYKTSTWDYGWSTIKARNYGRDNWYDCSYFLHMDAAPNTISSEGGRVTGKLFGRDVDGRVYWGLNFYQLMTDAATGRNWVNASGEPVRLSVKDEYYFKEWMSNFWAKFWTVCDLADGMVSCNTDNDPYGINDNWNVSTTNPGAAPVALVGDKPLTYNYEKVYAMWPRMTVAAGGSARLRYALGHAISHTWYWFNPENNYSAVEFGSKSGAFEIFLDAQEQNSSWLIGGQSSRNLAATAATPKVYSLSLPYGHRHPQIEELDGLGDAFTALGNGDLDGDGIDDLILLADGDLLSFASINVPDAGSTVVPRLKAVTILEDGESFAACADFNADGNDDLLIRGADGSFRALYVNSGAVSGESADLAGLPTGEMLGLGDFNGDGLPDLLFKSQSGDNPVFTVWFNGAAPWTYQVPLATVGTPWCKLFAAADCDGDGIDDMIWRDANTGAVYLTIFDTTGSAVSGGMPQFRGAPWKRGWELLAVADYNLDGRADYLWAKEKAKGAVLKVSFMDGFKPVPRQVAKSGLLRLPRGVKLLNPQSLPF